MLLTARSPARSPLAPSRFFGLALGLTAGGFVSPVCATASLIPARATYETTGTIDSAGMTGAPRVEFVGASGATDSAAPFSLGGFAVDPSSGGGVTTYDRTPVTIDLWTRAVDGISTAAGDGTPASPAVIHGWLSGTVGGTTPGTLSVMLDQGLQPDDPRFYQPHPLLPFPAGSSLGGANPSQSPGFLGFNHGLDLLSLDPTGGTTPLAGQLELAVPTPEPTSLLIFLAAGAGFALTRWRHG